MRIVSAFLIAALAVIFCCTTVHADEKGSLARAPDLVVYEIKPSVTDSAIHRFNEPNVVVFDRSRESGSQLVVFMPGTDGKPGNAMDLLRVVASQGYRVIGLEYDDSPAVIQVCPRKPPSCSGDFRRKRIFGDGVSDVVDNTAAESIVNRFAKLLRYLDQTYPTANWSEYLREDAPDWSRIVISGLSQGAGMAAYIAQREPVARVVLFSSPWDYTLASHSLAPWIAEPSVTPPERWFAEYHRRENTADLIAQAYAVLRIPAEHIRIFDLDLPAGYHAHSNNPYHGSTAHLPKYAPEWQFLFGSSP
jgi:predicted esterase